MLWYKLAKVSKGSLPSEIDNCHRMMTDAEWIENGTEMSRLVHTPFAVETCLRHVRRLEREIENDTADVSHVHHMRGIGTP